MLILEDLALDDEALLFQQWEQFPVFPLFLRFLAITVIVGPHLFLPLLLEMWFQFIVPCQDIP
jgi:hypothetical protein